jgi:drug/metabolite transporter (DMT)-like permease
METNYSVTYFSILPAMLNGVFLTLTSCLYSYALLKSDNPNINVLWYFAPLLAAVWLVVFGFSTATDMIVIGGGLIIVANVTLVLAADRKNKGEAALEEKWHEENETPSN